MVPGFHSAKRVQLWPPFWVAKMASALGSPIEDTPLPTIHPVDGVRKSMGPIFQVAVADLDGTLADEDIFEAAGTDWAWGEWDGGLLVTACVMPHPASSMFPTSIRPRNPHGLSIVSARSHF